MNIHNQNGLNPLLNYGGSIFKVSFIPTLTSREKKIAAIATLFCFFITGLYLTCRTFWQNDKEKVKKLDEVDLKQIEIKPENRSPEQSKNENHKSENVAENVKDIAPCESLPLSLSTKNDDEEASLKYIEELQASDAADVAEKAEIEEMFMAAQKTIHVARSAVITKADPIGKAAAPAKKDESAEEQLASQDSTKDTNAALKDTLPKDARETTVDKPDQPKAKEKNKAYQAALEKFQAKLNKEREAAKEAAATEEARKTAAREARAAAAKEKAAKEGTLAQRDITVIKVTYGEGNAAKTHTDRKDAQADSTKDAAPTKSDALKDPVKTIPKKPTVEETTTTIHQFALGIFGSAVKKT